MIAIFLALGAAASNAVASVLQRRAARELPAKEAFRPALVRDLLRRPIWFGGIAALIAGFLFQAAALSKGGLALVQPLLTAELPITMILVARFSRTRLGPGGWGAVAAVTAGLALLLSTAAPSMDTRTPEPLDWIIAAGGTVGAIAALMATAHVIGRSGSLYRAAILGVATGLGFAFTATFIKAVTRLLDRGFWTLFVSWPTYAMVVTGLGTLFLLQNALQSGSLVAAQPALTVSDPVASVIYGVTLFGETIRLGPWALAEAAGFALILYGSIHLVRTPTFREHESAARSPESSFAAGD
ncbi:MAG TPA: DMT family transporter [Streptosporangiaceae bacterium]